MWHHDTSTAWRGKGGKTNLCRRLKPTQRVPVVNKGQIEAFFRDGEHCATACCFIRHEPRCSPFVLNVAEDATLVAQADDDIRRALARRQPHTAVLLRVQQPCRHESSIALWHDLLCIIHTPERRGPLLRCQTVHRSLLRPSLY